MSHRIRSHRPLIMGRHGAVGTNHPAATQVGLDTLRAGGNAIDATVAISLALGVVEPHMSGLGGDGFYSFHHAASGANRTVNATGAAPANATAERFSKQGIAVTGPLSTSIPGKLAGLEVLHTRWGTLSWAGLCAPAITLAQDGFAVTHHYRHFAHEHHAALAADPRSRVTFLHDGKIPTLAALIRQPDLARTLEEIAADGAESFYRGRLARRFAARMAEMGAMISEDDLASCTAEEDAPIAITYRGHTITQTPLNSTGFVFAQMMKIVERFNLAGMDPDARVHLLVEAKKLAFLDRERHGADPRHYSAPIAEILSDPYIDELVAQINPDRAASRPIATPEKASETTYFCVVDAAGNGVSAIQSINGAFGSGVTAGDTGILLNNRMAYWHLAQGHVNRLQPGKRVRHTMNAPMIFKEGKLWGVEGTPGADNQVQINLQIVTAMIDDDMDPQMAVESPRWTSSQQGQGANWPHDGDASLTIEPGFGTTVLAALERRGHKLKLVGLLEGPCSVQAIRIAANGVRMAGSDPRRDGWAGAY
ncbi:MAG: gamma-glutamyltransferase [Acetobacteraceae bacterium]|nr:gamma-glutamyltransferase [Acetobacteraceae bacterium]MSP29099.1 gamma-glutamyltransferase [Acetobacteraceae bacterium]